MQTTPTIQDLATQVQASQRRVATARSAVEADKALRAGSWRARLVDMLTTTPAEAELNDAEAQLKEHFKVGTHAAQEWIIAIARQRLSEQPKEAELHRMQKRRVEHVTRRAGQVKEWLELTSTAASQLNAARSACESASTTELLDAFSKSKAISALSYMDTSSASDAVKRARVAVKALADALPKRTENGDIDQPDDLLDLVMDLAFDPGVDLLSWFNMGRLDDAARQCREAAAKLRPLLGQLSRLTGEAQAKVEEERAKLSAIEAPYLDAAANEVPEVLRPQNAGQPAVTGKAAVDSN